MVLQRGTADFGITIATIPLAVVAFALSAYALRREFKWSGFIYITRSLIAVAHTRPRMMAACLLMLAGVVGLLGTYLKFAARKHCILTSWFSV